MRFSLLGGPHCVSNLLAEARQPKRESGKDPQAAAVVRGFEGFDDPPGGGTMAASPESTSLAEKATNWESRLVLPT